ncbi:MAG: hypothetical protein ACTIBA_07280 [Lactobacillus delbrueckii]|uniref:hypothetical protein n=1 Tax=Lactobacillus delbrueckii TaxID=1584 RepID=UPI0013C4518F|nr:hypothetical protein [Lactobacillus delbrueckii]MCD5449435.1 hypothetical protein [Lactobacillus delbrueckii subsp. bulgaricus]MCD5455033.1 hypothetical protein [Lactobacillus delbrueckii subsp. bulgaricus]MCD5460093.1 hypothetical protein [Lactobacillus delbrueckii subsp. bulgaricus]MCD5466941.1 hypothetical protein [Lactobacillus delbrueckii subsp. bulgaricus]MCD5475657.1 hypothetical protein [Lactobacillus delbrueckii subsp. bulgaricus]
MDVEADHFWQSQAVVVQKVLVSPQEVPLSVLPEDAQLDLVGDGIPEVFRLDIPATWY